MGSDWPPFLGALGVLPADHWNSVSLQALSSLGLKGCLSPVAAPLLWRQSASKDKLMGTEGWTHLLQLENLSFRAITACFLGGLTDNSWCQQ